jgi:tripartite-type tricarboxylate transporter receptor subunit TctC
MTRPAIAMGVALAALLALQTGPAQAFPEREVTYIIPFNPGGESDVTARLQEPVWRELTGHGFVVQYLVGAGGATAWTQLNGMTADGYTIMGINLPHLFLQPIEGNVGYRTEDIDVVHIFQLTPFSLNVLADSEIGTLEDFIAYGKDNPGRITVAGTGTNSANHVAYAWFDNAAGITTTYVPFTGTAATTTALLGNQVMAQWAFPTVAAEQGDAVRMLAIATEERHPRFPDVPTFREKGFDFVDGAYRGVAVPRGTPEEVKAALSDLFTRINRDPGFAQTMDEGGYVLVEIEHDQVGEFMRQGLEEYTEIARLIGLIN